VFARERRAAVVGVDASAALIEIAQQRAPGGDFRVGDLEDLPFDDVVFDAAQASTRRRPRRRSGTPQTRSPRCVSWHA
jgi:ubiquinone/menaquinone biosynthesis C-methylase UbiE